MNRHTVRSYDEEIKELHAKIAHMGEEVADQLHKAIQALVSGDEELAQLVVEGDMAVNKLQLEVDTFTVNLLARRQPVALDLRSVVTTSKIAADLERIADYASNIAKYVAKLEQGVRSTTEQSIASMGKIAKEMLLDVIQAYIKTDMDQAKKVWCRDEEINAIYEELLVQVERIMMEDSSCIQACTMLLFVGRCCERIGDHIKNIAESVHYIASGDLMHPDECR